MADLSVTRAYSTAAAALQSASRNSVPLPSAASVPFPFPRPSHGHICEKCTNIPVEILLVGSSFFSNRCKGQHAEDEACKGKHNLSCDQCSATITESHFHCFLCNEGDFDICPACRTNGKGCKDSSHKLHKRCFEDGMIREVDETGNTKHHPGITEELLKWAVEPYRLHDNYEDLEASASAGCHSCSTILSRLEKLIEGKCDETRAVYIENRPLAIPRNVNFVKQMARMMAAEPDLDDGADEGMPTTVVAVRSERDPLNPTFWDDDRDAAVAYLAYEFRNNDRSYRSRFVDWGLENRLLQLSPIVGESNNLKVVGSWLHSCQAAKSRCSTVLRTQLKPTRLLEVSQTDSNHQLLRLVEGDSIEGDTVDYVTLSYCWGIAGQQHPWILTKERLPEFSKEITPEKLPRTIADAVNVVRTNNIRYIWIDSICIVQDDAADWEREAYRMGSVYSNSLFTIVSGSDSATGGLFLPRDQLKVSAAKFSTTYGSDSRQYDIVMYPFLDDSAHPTVATSTRAWCYQEELLSARRLYFSKDQFRWECLCSEHHEAGRYSPGDSPSTSYTEPMYDSNVLFADSQVVGEWYSIITQYTSRSITYHGDIFAALAGIAAAFKEKCKSQQEIRYLAGLWEDDMMNGLLWHRVGKSLSRPSEFQAPSWSWLSVQGQVVFNRGYNAEGSADAEYISGFVETLNNKEFGKTMPGGSLRLRARLLRCEIGANDDEQDFVKMQNIVQDLPMRETRRSDKKKVMNSGSDHDGEDDGSNEEQDESQIAPPGKEEVDAVEVEEDDTSVEDSDTASADTDSNSDSNYVLRSGPWEMSRKDPVTPPGDRLDMAARVKLLDGPEFATIFFDGEEEAKTENFVVAYISATHRPGGVIDRNGIALACVEKEKYRRIGFVAFWDKLLSGEGDLKFLEEADKAEITLI